MTPDPLIPGDRIAHLLGYRNATRAREILESAGVRVWVGTGGKAIVV